MITPGKIVSHAASGSCFVVGYAAGRLLQGAVSVTGISRKVWRWL